VEELEVVGAKRGEYLFWSRLRENRRFKLKPATRWRCRRP